MNSTLRNVRRVYLMAVALLAVAGAPGCFAGHAVDADSEAPYDDEPVVASSEEALIRASGGLSATGECDKSIEGDCENLTALCTDDTVDDLIRCIEGWATTHCSCTLASVSAPPKPKFKLPIGNLEQAVLTRAAR
jgi:hypothetical protein